MNKTPDNHDFEDLFRVYTESSCAFNKKVEDDEEEKDESETVKEELEEDEDEEEETVEEGMLDNLKSKVNRQVSRVGALKDAGKEMWKSGAGAAGKGYQQGKSQRIFQNHINRIDSLLSALVTDAVKTKMMDPDEAEQFASEISSMVRKKFAEQNKGRGFQSKNQKFDRMKGYKESP